ncbi:hypothetical protein ACFP2F_22860 [Hymenobacter artigasi]|jgi:hypothetical protein|uniref:Uncharacterized protein n=1 Tax=Hymenobacter artigasi TaxID=2719616 RepID=A0ABX1HP47_9BACT|nr:hypothetical protein [Hymenobacter artigasi]NKI92028.1 hypothetical protein [Hymenobacter artigasi]
MAQRVITEVISLASTSLATKADYTTSFENNPTGDTANALKEGWIIKQISTCIESGYHCSTVVLEKPD